MAQRRRQEILRLDELGEDDHLLLGLPVEDRVQRGQEFHSLRVAHLPEPVDELLKLLDSSSSPSGSSAASSSSFSASVVSSASRSSSRWASLSAWLRVGGAELLPQLHDTAAETLPYRMGTAREHLLVRDHDEAEGEVLSACARL